MTMKKNGRFPAGRPVPAGRTIAAGEFKAKCLAILDRVASTGESVTVTKRGRPVASVAPVRVARPKSLRGSVTYLGDIVAPLGEKWEADS